jgi:hypothetical protein
MPQSAARCESCAWTVAGAAAHGHGGHVARPSPLDDPESSAYAWARYWRLIRGMGLFTAVTVCVVLSVLYFFDGMVSIHFFIATALGVGAAMMLMAALMGLVFLSSGTGHDESVSDPSEAGRD